MRLLKIEVEGLRYYPEGFALDFFAKQRVMSSYADMLSHQFSNIYTNNVISLVGMNAAGKTTTLKVVSFVLDLIQNQPINNILHKDILVDSLRRQEDKVRFKVWFIQNKSRVVLLETVVGIDEKQDFIITRETIWQKQKTEQMSKKNLLLFEEKHIEQTRTFQEEYLLDDVSLIVSLNKKEKKSSAKIDLIHLTNENMLRFLGEYPSEIVAFLDPNIEYLTATHCEENNSYKFSLKFKDSEELQLYSPKELANYLSSGTMKGINVFISAISTLQDGGYLLVDELENHFHKEITTTLIQFFLDPQLNTNGATLIFSTHYVELLDVLERGDSIYVLRNKQGISVNNFSDFGKRDDLKKSEVFFSGDIENTAPQYDSYILLKREMKQLFQQKSDVY